MSNNNKEELTGPYNTLSVIERTKALGLVPDTSPGKFGKTWFKHFTFNK